ncbi:hypothetical protein SAMN05216559_1993 [Halomicrobium zhouii]|uniref:DUF4870 domain-containing protein n=1 Tax=Halomicrobium zhouii TaxID=767519 RepID=A0A1I6L412_9EURY|nr:DUF4870 domain-containing protein [Halomicrobium zhouii]SFR98211.1 hypothetical protein SAMN05216559_1993 [Halomicrobium zhouii]
MATEPSDEAVSVDESHGEADVEAEVSDDERTWAIIVHAMGFVGLAIPLANVFGPLLVWAIKKDEGPFVDENGKQAINFQITWTVLLTVSALSIFVGLGLVVFPIVGIAWLVLTGIAVVRASNDEVYDYPLTVDVIS